MVFTNDNKPAFKSRAPTEISLSSFNISPALVFAAIHSIKCKHSIDPEGLTSLFYHQLAAELRTPLSIIMQTSMNSHTLPIAWKNVNICALHKKGITSHPSNYSPISLTGVACKIMEPIISDNLLSYLKFNNLISLKQHGFLECHSTEKLVIRNFK